MLTHIANIWRKELMDTIRDKKAFRQALLVPLLVGIAYAVMNPLLISLVQSKAGNPLAIPTQGLAYADPTLVSVLAKFDITLVSFDGDMTTAIASGQQAAGLIIPPGFKENIDAQQPVTLRLLLNPTTGGPFGGSFSGERLESAINAYNQLVARSRLEQVDIDPQLLTPVGMDTQDLSTPAQRAGLLASFMLPILVGVVVVQGGLFIAIDVTAGEKERHTLEALLVTPTTDAEIFLGKLAAVFTMSTFPIVLTLMGYWAASNLLPASMTDGAVLPIAVVLGAIVLTLPLALFVNVVLMIISIRTKTFKDAQSSAVPVNLGVVFTAMAAAFAPPTSASLFLIPVYGTSAVIGSLAVGGTVAWQHIAFSVGGSLAAVLVGVFFALKLFNRERLLYSA